MTPSPTPPPPPSPQSLAERIDHLFATVHPKDRGPYSYEEVASEIKRRGGPTISASYIWQLRTGGKDNPTKRHLEALGSFFGVPVAYFFDDEESQRIQAEIDALAAMRDIGVRSVALRASGLSDKSLKIISDVIDRARELEGLRSKESESDIAPDKQSDTDHQ
ncbi:helix-turn-helix domain-containing protein [Streptomyces albidoflavus]|uniref:helix-turn-helix domain-containing protein n=1 Tax=Streptomyces albidoflavus TaxID=1886 RepID=UPI0033E52E7F